MVISIVVSKDNREEKTREVADISFYTISWNFLWQGCDMLWLWWLTWDFFFIILTRLTTLSTYELVVDDTVDGKDNLEEKAREVVDIRMYFGWNFLQLGCNLLSWWWLISVFFIYSTSVTTLRSCVLMVNHTVDGKDNSMEETIVVIDIMMYHFT